MAENNLKCVKRKEYFPKFLTCLCGRVVSKSHLPTLILTCLWTSANESPAAGSRNDLRDRSPIQGFRVFQELYQAKPGTALLVAL